MSDDKGEGIVNQGSDSSQTQPGGVRGQRWIDMSALPDDFFRDYSAGIVYDFKALRDHLSAAAFRQLQESLPYHKRPGAGAEHKRLAEDIGIYQTAALSVALGAEFDRYSAPMLDLIRQLRARVAELEAAAESKPAGGDADGSPAAGSDGYSAAGREPGSAREATA